MLLQIKVQRLVKIVFDDFLCVCFGEHIIRFYSDYGRPCIISKVGSAT